jgi:hypothetical protein
VLTVVLGVAVIGIAMLAIAVLTGNNIVALVVIAIAVLGLVLLARDWLAERRLVDGMGEDDRWAADEAENGHAPVSEHNAPALEPDEYQPDVLDEEPNAPADDAADDTQEGEYDGAGYDSGTSQPDATT